MKKALTRLAVAIIATIALSSCAGATLYPTLTLNENSTNVCLSQNNFSVEGTTSGTATATYIFGIGGLSDRALKSNAIADMYANAHLYGSMAVVNINTVRKVTSIMGIYSEVTYIASGNVIKFHDN